MHQPLIRGVGLTLSDAQAELAQRFSATQAHLPQIEIRVESWADHRPAEPYGALISVGAFEHFTKPADASPTKIAIYREFFTRCRDMLAPESRMTLQTIAYGDPEDKVPAGALVEDIFPRVGAAAPAGDPCREPTDCSRSKCTGTTARTTVEPASYRAANLKARRLEAVQLVGKEQTRRYERYLKFAAWGFWSHRLHLLRFRLKRR